MPNASPRGSRKEERWSRRGFTPKRGERQSEAHKRGMAALSARYRTEREDVVDPDFMRTQQEHRERQAEFAKLHSAGSPVPTMPTLEKSDSPQQRGSPQILSPAPIEQGIERIDLTGTTPKQRKQRKARRTIIAAKDRTIIRPQDRTVVHPRPRSIEGSPVSTTPSTPVPQGRQLRFTEERGGGRGTEHRYLSPAFQTPHHQRVRREHARLNVELQKQKDRIETASPIRMQPFSPWKKPAGSPIREQFRLEQAARDAADRQANMNAPPSGGGAKQQAIHRSLDGQIASARNLERFQENPRQSDHEEHFLESGSELSISGGMGFGEEQKQFRRGDKPTAPPAPDLRTGRELSGLEAAQMYATQNPEDLGPEERARWETTQKAFGQGRYHGVGGPQLEEDIRAGAPTRPELRDPVGLEGGFGADTGLEEVFAGMDVRERTKEVHGEAPVTTLQTYDQPQVAGLELERPQTPPKSPSPTALQQKREEDAAKAHDVQRLMDTDDPTTAEQKTVEEHKSQASLSEHDPESRESVTMVRPRKKKLKKSRAQRESDFRRRRMEDLERQGGRGTGAPMGATPATRRRQAVSYSPTPARARPFTGVTEEGAPNPEQSRRGGGPAGGGGARNPDAGGGPRNPDAGGGGGNPNDPYNLRHWRGDEPRPHDNPGGGDPPQDPGEDEDERRMKKYFDDRDKKQISTLRDLMKRMHHRETHRPQTIMMPGSTPFAVPVGQQKPAGDSGITIKQTVKQVVSKQKARAKKAVAGTRSTLKNKRKEYVQLKRVVKKRLTTQSKKRVNARLVDVKRLPAKERKAARAKVKAEEKSRLKKAASKLVNATKKSYDQLVKLIREVSSLTIE